MCGSEIIVVRTVGGRELSDILLERPVVENYSIYLEGMFRSASKLEGKFYWRNTHETIYINNSSFISLFCWHHQKPNGPYASSSP